MTPEPAPAGAAAARRCHHATARPAARTRAGPPTADPTGAALVQPPRRPAREPEPGPALHAPLVADVPEGDVAGALSRVPALPLRYVVRDELDGLVDAVVGTTSRRRRRAHRRAGRCGPARASAGSASRCLPLLWPPTTESVGGSPTGCSG